MFIVASTWEILDGKHAEATELGAQMRQLLRAVPGIESIQHFLASDNEFMVIVTYSDEAAYNRIINEPEGPFEKGLKAVNLESAMRWKQSWRGTPIPV